MDHISCPGSGDYSDYYFMLATGALALHWQYLFREAFTTIDINTPYYRSEVSEVEKTAPKMEMVHKKMFISSIPA